MENLTTQPTVNPKISEERPMVGTMEEPKEGNKPILVALIAVAIVLVGTGAGYFLSQKISGGTGGKMAGTIPTEKDKVRKGEVYGVSNTKNFPDKAEGVIKVNDKSFTSEGSHILIRDKDPSHNAYLTSTVLDLNLFVDKKVEVWGQTFAAQKAGWLMDVGQIKVLE